MSTSEPVLGDITRRLIEVMLAEVHTIHPAKVVSYDVTTDRADVQPLIKRKYSGVLELQDLPVIEDAPVLWFRAAGWEMSSRLAPGNLVLLLVSERSITRWLDATDRTKTIDPGDKRKHDLTDAFVLPWIVAGNADGSADLVIKRFDGNVLRLGANGAIDLGNGDLQAVGRVGDGVEINSTTAPDFFTWISAVSSAGPGVVPPFTGTITGRISSGSGKVKSG